MSRFSDDGKDLDLEKALTELKTLNSGSEKEKMMMAFFQEEVVPEIAYTDNDINQGKGGPKRIFVEGKWKRYDLPELKIRLGISPDFRLIPSLQLILGNKSWNRTTVIEYTDMYGPMLEYAKAWGDNYNLVLKLASDFPKIIGLYAEKNRIEQELNY